MGSLVLTVSPVSSLILATMISKLLWPVWLLLWLLRILPASIPVLSIRETEVPTPTPQPPPVGTAPRSPAMLLLLLPTRHLLLPTSPATRLPRRAMELLRRVMVLRLLGMKPLHTEHPALLTEKPLEVSTSPLS